MLLAVAAQEGLALRQFDICTAFHNGELKEEVFIRAPAGAEHLAGGSGRVLRLRRVLHGLRQAPRAWNQRLETELRSRGFVQSDADPALWILHGENSTVLSMFYVDDGLVAARTDVEADALVELVASIFEIRALGEPKDFLGIEFSRDHAANTITITQKSKASALAAELGVSGCRRVLPMPSEVYAGLRDAHSGVPMADKQLYQQVLGSLLHLAQCTRPDIALPVSALGSLRCCTNEGASYSSCGHCEIRWQHCSAGHHLWWEAEAPEILVRCKFCSVSGHTKKYNGLGCHHIWGSSVLE
jgi:hypothetical protein